MTTLKEESWMNDAAIPAGMTSLRLPTGGPPLDTHGRLVDYEDNDSGSRPRWAVLHLYEIFDTNPEHNDSLPDGDPFRGMYGKTMYLIYTVGHSVIYHSADTPCNTGVRVAVKDIETESQEHPDDLEPCPRCQPGNWRDMAPGDQIQLETTWFKWKACRTPEDVVTGLLTDPKCATCHHKPHEGRQCDCGCTDYVPAPQALSVPGAKLLEKARRHDKNIAAVLDTPLRI
jgi:hypothetical protein